MPKKSSQKGVSILLTVLILSAVFALGLGVATFVISEIRQSRNVGNFVSALHAADSGVERTLYKVRQLGEFSSCPTVDTCSFSGELGTGASFNVIILDSGMVWCTSDAPNFCIRSIGSFQDANRAIEVTI